MQLNDTDFDTLDQAVNTIMGFMETFIHEAQADKHYIQLPLYKGDLNPDAVRAVVQPFRDLMRFRKWTTSPNKHCPGCGRLEE